MSTSAILNAPRPWPFGRSELTAGLRRKTGDPTLRIVELGETDLPNLWPSVARIRGVKVTCAGSTGDYEYELVLKESLQQGRTRAGTAGPGPREVSFYRHLTDQVPVRIPQVISYDPYGEWLVMNRMEDGRHPETWNQDDYKLATAQLAILHDRFWGLGSDLAVYPWLARPLDSDFQVNIKVASNAINRLVQEPDARLFNRDTASITLLRHLVSHANKIAQGLRRAPETLLHGDYWPGNIHMDRQSRLTVYDWQQAGIGPGVIDLLSFIQTSRWWFDPLPLDTNEIIATYRSNLSEKTGIIWANQEWQALMDHALMWIFLVNWLDTLASTPSPILATRMPQLESLWLHPLRDAVARSLPVD